MSVRPRFLDGQLGATESRVLPPSPQCWGEGGRGLGILGLSLAGWGLLAKLQTSQGLRSLGKMGGPLSDEVRLP